MKCRTFTKFFFAVCLSGLLCAPLAGCTGVEDEPVGVDDQGVVEEESEEFVEGERADMREQQ